jgi:hypothetical protein
MGYSAQNIVRPVAVVVVLAVLCVLQVFHTNSGGSDTNHNNHDSPIIRRRLDNLPANIDISNALIKGQEVLSLIKHRYELDTQPGKSFWFSATSMSSHIWDILKYKYASKIVEGNNQQFLMVFAGSSVTAGHDGYYNESYPSIVLARMQPILKLVGVELVMHNIAQGANNCIPYSYCYESMGGMDPDFVGWEQAYNCGHDDPVFELVARMASMSANRAIIYYSASGAWKPDKCPKSPDAVPYCSLDWTPKIAGLTDWKPTHDEILEQKKVLDDFYRGGDSANRFASWAKSDPKYAAAIGPHEFNVWQPNSQCQWEKDGKHQTNCNAFDGSMGCTLKFMTWEAAQ